MKASGYADGMTQVTVKAGDTPATVALSLLPIEEKSTINWAQIGGFSALGVGVALGAAGLATSLRVKRFNDEEFSKEPVKSYREHRGKDTPSVCVDIDVDVKKK